MIDQLIPHDAWIFVGDGRKALFLRNEGNVNEIKLKTEQVLVSPEQGKSRELGTDRPTRGYQSFDGRRSATEETDWHELAEERFAIEVSTAIGNLCRNGTVKKLVLIAPPKTLATLRKELPETVRPLIAAEIHKDLTKHPVLEIERLLSAG